MIRRSCRCCRGYRVARADEVAVPTVFRATACYRLRLLPNQRIDKHVRAARDALKPDAGWLHSLEGALRLDCCEGPRANGEDAAGCEGSRTSSAPTDKTRI